MHPVERPNLESGDIVEVVDDAGTSELGVVRAVIDYSEDSDPSIWEVWVATRSDSGMFDPDRVRRLPGAQVEDLADPDLRAECTEARRRR